MAACRGKRQGQSWPVQDEDHEELEFMEALRPQQALFDVPTGGHCDGHGARELKHSTVDNLNGASLALPVPDVCLHPDASLSCKEG